jgi:signal transduction histidine kinase/chemotaxis response regulator CheB
MPNDADPPPLPAPGSVPICGIGASAGGVEALQHFFAALPDDLGLAYVVIVHLAPDRKSELPSIIARWTTMPVVQVADHQQEKLAPDSIYVIGPDRKLVITDTSVGASPFDQPRGQRTAIDLFFRSLAAAHGDGFAVVLSGSGCDGAAGAKAVKESGGLVLVQDPRDAQHGDMPRATIATGSADIVLPARELALRLAELARSKQMIVPLERGSLNEEYRSTTEELETSKEDLQSINEELRTANNELKLKLEEICVDITAIKSAESALHESERRLADELMVMRRLHRMTLAVSTAPGLAPALDEILRAAIDLHGADLGNIQLYERASRQLRIVAQNGFTPPFLEYFRVVGVDDGTSSGRALRTLEPSRIADVTADPGYLPFRAIAAEAGYRAVQSVPLITRAGEITGVLSVHFAAPHAFHERDRQLGDLLGRQAADLIESRTQLAELEASQERLSRQAQELIEQDRNRDDFIATLGHELRNPMAAIQNSLAVISASDPTSQRALTILRRQSQHMTRLINDLLDVTRVKHGKLRLQRATVDVDATVLAALDAVRSQADKKGLRLEYQAPLRPPSVDADAERLAQILDNLLRNAIACTDAGAVTVTVAQQNGMMRITVHDTGEGIAADDIANVFEAYRQVDPERRSDGLGLGLSLVKMLVEAHGGTIDVRSPGRGRGSGGGSAFSFTIPIAAEEPVPPAPSPVWGNAPARRVLVVDDQADVADMLAAMLRGLGQQTWIAYGGAEALGLAREHRPDIVLLDLSMPDVSGSEVARILRHEFGPDVMALVAVTGAARPRGTNFQHYLLKPVTPDHMLALLNSLVEPA